MFPNSKKWRILLQHSFTACMPSLIIIIIIIKIIIVVVAVAVAADLYSAIRS